MNYENRPDKVRTIMAIWSSRYVVQLTQQVLPSLMAHGLLTFSSFAPQFLSSCPFAHLVN
ncbi:hypothetical protein PILCRDRAFT_822787, partial [Piloderma croceum F 1598]